MSRPVVHVVGAGVAGLSAALSAAQAGHEVRLYEAAGHAGGRCGAVQGDGHDNGTHVVLGANRKALAFLRDVGALDRWLEPEPAGLPVVDLETGRVHVVGLSPSSWRGLPGLGPAAGFRLLRLAAPLLRDRPVADLAGEGAFSRFVLTPLTLAALNTPPADASARRLGTVLRRLVAPGAGRLLVARAGLGPDLVEPALAALAALGTRPRFRMRLRGWDLGPDGPRCLRFASGTVELAPGDTTILALPAHAVARLLPAGSPPPDRFEPIVNAHFACAYAGPVRFVGLVGGTGQWVLFRPGSASVTVSAARAEVGMPAEEVFARVTPEVGLAAASLGLPIAGLKPRRVVKERRATPSHPPGPWVAVPVRPFPNLVLAGDWLSPLPATIEAAVASGRAAARLVRAPAAGRGARQPVASSA